MVIIFFFALFHLPLVWLTPAANRWYRWCTLTWNISAKFWKNSKWSSHAIVRGLGEDYSRKKPEAKISWHCHFKWTHALAPLFFQSVYMYTSRTLMTRQIWGLFAFSPGESWFDWAKKVGRPVFLLSAELVFAQISLFMNQINLFKEQDCLATSRTEIVQLYGFELNCSKSGSGNYFADEMWSLAAKQNSVTWRC